METLQIKVLREPATRDAEGNPLSKGIAFAEFTDPEHAVCALRQLNNNPAPFGKSPRSPEQSHWQVHEH